MYYTEVTAVYAIQIKMPFDRRLEKQIDKMLIKGYVSVENVNTPLFIRHSIHTIHETVKGMGNFFLLFFFFFYFFYLKNHHVTNRRFRRSVFLGPDKRNLSHVFRRVSKDRKFFQRIPGDYGQDYDPGVDSSPNTLLNLLSCPFRLGASAS